MRNHIAFPKITSAIVLAGGMGTRLRAVCPDKPKPMIPVIGRPFLDYLVKYIARQGIVELVISTGYLGDQIEHYFGSSRYGIVIRCVRESQPMGTGGAIRFASEYLSGTQPFLALNGDSIAPFNLSLLSQTMHAGNSDGALVGVQVPDQSRFGSLVLNSNNRLVGFREKTEQNSSAIINAGIYLLSAELLSSIQHQSPASVEKDYFPFWLSSGKNISVVINDGPFIDIGTPESLAEAPEFFRNCGLFSEWI
jgi:D-glycero-alpha-D-manno-heptose 1-phosphate guanylyltransferase